MKHRVEAQRHFGVSPAWVVIIMLGFAAVLAGTQEPVEEEGLELGEEWRSESERSLLVEQSAPPSEVDDLIIDVHSHIFNAWDLPLVSYLKKQSPLAVPFARLIVSWIRRRAPIDKDAVIELAEACLMDARERSTVQLPCTNEGAGQVFRQAVAEVDPEVAESLDWFGEAGRGLHDDETDLDWARRGPRLVRFISAAHRSRTHQARTLAGTYPSVNLFIPAMVDMDGWAKVDRKLLRLKDRVAALERALLTVNAESPGLMHPFFGFNPRHAIPEYDREYVPRYREYVADVLLKRGFLGVKIYPAFGFFPIDNESMDIQGLDRPQHGAEIDRELKWLYAFAQEHGIPIMAHCNDEGAQLGNRHAEVFGHPENWRRVLEQYPDLRLSLGHFGRVRELLADDGSRDTWPWIIARMMEEYSNLYADLAYDGTPSQVQHSEMVDVLLELLKEHPVARRRLMYGTDWFMLLHVKDSAQYYERYDSKLTNELIGSETRRNFFGRTATRFLGLADERTRERLVAYYQANAIKPPPWLGGRRPAPAVGADAALSHAVEPSSPPAEETRKRKATKKRALLVGIDKYRHGEINRLRGCKYDVADMKDLLIRKFEFPEEGILPLLDKEATRDAILRGMEDHLFAGANRDSVLVFYFSGHGSQKAGNESDGYDETLVPYDSGRPKSGHENRDITDDELNELLTKIAAETHNVTVILDSCHSGTATRGASPRSAEADPLLPADYAQDEEGTAFEADEGRYVLLAAAGADQRAFEDEYQGKQRGAFTWSLTKELRQRGGEITYADIIGPVAASVQKRFRNQQPQLEGTERDKLVFGTRSRSRTMVASASPLGAEEIKLDWGIFHGITEGSVFEVFAPDAVFDPGRKRPKSGLPIGVAEIVEVGGGSSIARLVSGGPIEPYSRAIEIKHNFRSIHIRVCFEKTSRRGFFKRVRNKLSQYRHIKVVEPGEGCELLVRPEAGIEVRDRPDWAARSLTVSPESGVEHAVGKLLSWAKWLNIRSIENPGSILRMKVDVESDDWIRPPGGGGWPVVREGRRKLRLFVTNESAQKLYIHILVLGENGEVNPFFPGAPGAAEFVPSNGSWRLTVPVVRPARGQARSLDTIIVFATTNDGVDLSFLAHGPVSFREEASSDFRDPLEQLLANAAFGGRDWGAADIDDWTVARTFVYVER